MSSCPRIQQGHSPAHRYLATYNQHSTYNISHAHRHGRTTTMLTHTAAWHAATANHSLVT